MVLTKLLSNENGIVRYMYQPEKDGEPGILLYDKLNNKPEIEKLAENDIKSTFYRDHVFGMIRKNLNNPPKERLLIWY